MEKLSWMTRVRRRWNSTLKGRAGQSTVEYILILAIVVMIAGKVKNVLKTKVLDEGIGKLDFDRVMSQDD